MPPPSQEWRARSMSRWDRGSCFVRLLRLPLNHSLPPFPISSNLAPDYFTLDRQWRYFHQAREDLAQGFRSGVQLSYRQLRLTFVQVFCWLTLRFFRRWRTKLLVGKSGELEWSGSFGGSMERRDQSFEKLSRSVSPIWRSEHLGRFVSTLRLAISTLSIESYLNNCDKYIQPVSNEWVARIPLIQ